MQERWFGIGNVYRDCCKETKGQSPSNFKAFFLWETLIIMYIFPCVEEWFKTSKLKYFCYMSLLLYPTAYSTSIPRRAAALSTMSSSVLRGVSMPTPSPPLHIRCYSQICLESLYSFLDWRYSSNQALDLWWFSVSLISWYIW